MEVTRGTFSISTDSSRLDHGLIHDYLSRFSYWARSIPREIVDRSIQGSLCFGIYDGDSQVGFARVISDRATFAYVCDVFVLESHRGHGLGIWLMEVIRAHPDLQGLYEKSGFRKVEDPVRYMEILDRQIYERR
jgi:GNAT superfamily N-acetyltransferase